MKKTIRQLKYEEIEQALKLIWSVFEEFEAPEYSTEGVEEFKIYIGLDAAKQRFNEGRLFLGAFIGDELAGVLEARKPAHISMMFVDKQYHRQGLAKMMFNEALSTLGANDITVNSSPYAIEIYKRLGFNPTDEEQITNGIRYTPMVRKYN